MTEAGGTGPGTGTPARSSRSTADGRASRCAPGNVGGAVDPADEPERRRTRTGQIAGDSVSDSPGASSPAGSALSPLSMMSGNREFAATVAVHRPAVWRAAGEGPQVVPPVTVDAGSGPPGFPGVRTAAPDLIARSEPGFQSVVRRSGSRVATCAEAGPAVARGSRASGAGRPGGVPEFREIRCVPSALAAVFPGAPAPNDSAGEWSWWLVRTIARFRR